jgi:drug/metabolite transporter (DMT)-like permease
LFLGEVPTLLGFVGGALALGGVAISRRRSLRRRDRDRVSIRDSVPDPAA